MNNKVNYPMFYRTIEEVEGITKEKTYIFYPYKISFFISSVLMYDYERDAGKAYEVSILGVLSLARDVLKNTLIKVWWRFLRFLVYGGLIIVEPGEAVQLKNFKIRGSRERRKKIKKVQ